MKRRSSRTGKSRIKKRTTTTKKNKIRIEEYRLSGMIIRQKEKEDSNKEYNKTERKTRFEDARRRIRSERHVKYVEDNTMYRVPKKE